MSLAGGRAPGRPREPALWGFWKQRKKMSSTRRLMGGFTRARAGPRKREEIKLKGVLTERNLGQRGRGEESW